MATYREVRIERLNVKVPGTDQLRRTAAGSLRHLLATGWQETGRTVRSDHVELRLERSSSAPVAAHHPRLSTPPAVEPGARRDRPR